MVFSRKRVLFLKKINLKKNHKHFLSQFIFFIERYTRISSSIKNDIPEHWTIAQQVPNSSPSHNHTLKSRGNKEAK